MALAVPGLISILSFPLSALTDENSIRFICDSTYSDLSIFSEDLLPKIATGASGDLKGIVRSVKLEGIGQYTIVVRTNAVLHRYFPNSTDSKWKIDPEFLVGDRHIGKLARVLEVAIIEGARSSNDLADDQLVINYETVRGQVLAASTSTFNSKTSIQFFIGKVGIRVSCSFK